MKPSGLSQLNPASFFAAISAVMLLASSASAQLIAYDDAGNYQFNASANANWTNGANQGFGFTPWAILTNGPDNHGDYIVSGNSPAFVIATNVLGTNCVWGIYANGPTDENETMAFRGFASSLGTNTFKLQWGARGAGSTTTTNSGVLNGWCGFSLRNGNNTNFIYSFQNISATFDPSAQLFVFFQNGRSPSTIYIYDGAGVTSVPNTSFSDLGRGNITNAIEAEITPAADGSSYYLILKDCVQNRTIYTYNGSFFNSGQTVDSVALFCDETTGDQDYNRMQIVAATNIPPTISNIQPADGSLYLSTATQLSFEMDSFNSTVASSAVSVYLNGVLQTGLTFNTTSPTTQLLGQASPALAANTFYNYTIVAQDANGNVVSNNYTFNTFDPNNNLFIDAMDYNYNGGQFANPPGVALDGGLLGTNGIDYLDVTTLTNLNNYRPGNAPLPQLIPITSGASGETVDHEGFESYNSGLTDYQLAYTDQSEWDNYTRVFPVTNYTIYARAASAGGGQFELARLANPTASVSNQPAAVLGTFTVQNTGGSTVFSGQLSPLLDFFGTTVVLPLAGTNTLQQIATQSRTYNLSYLIFVTNSTGGTLRPYISIGSIAPNSTGVPLTTPISFTLVNRQTTVTTNTLQLFLSTTTNSVTTTTNLTSHLVLNSNAAGVTASYTPTGNLPANSSNTVTVIFTDSAGVSVTNVWNFVTGTAGGTVGSGVWSGAGGVNDEFWADAINWTGNTPGPGSVATFASPGATTSLVTNNIVATNVTIGQLNYSTNSSGFHTTWIQDGVTVTVTNGATANGTQAFTIGGAYTGGGLGTLTDNAFNPKVTNTITGANGTLLVLGNPQGSGLANALNFQVRQCAAVAAPEQTVLDMSGLGTFVATVGKFTVGQGGSGTFQSNCTARVNLARTNIITLLRFTSGLFVVGDSSGGAFTLPGNTLNLGLTNALYFDSANIGSKKATNALVRFNPIFTNANPAVYIRDTNGPTSRVSLWTVGNVNGETTVPVFNSGTVDFSGGTLDALVGTMTLGTGSTLTTDTGYAQGTLTFTAGTLNVTNLQIGVQKANNMATETGIMNVNGTATLVGPNIMLAQTGGGSASLVTGTLNVTNGTVQGGIFSGGGVSTVNVNGGTLVVSNNAGTAAAPLTALNLSSASLHLKVDGSAPAAKVNAAAVSANGTTITIDSVANVTAATTIHLINYSGTDPYAGLTLAPMPAGYSGSLADNSGSIDLTVNVAPTTRPTIRNLTFSSGQLIINGTNNVGSGGAGGGYHVLTSTNVALSLTNWTVLTNGTFDASGNFSSTNETGTNSARFYILRVP
jgi:hypothetical protein